MEDLLPYMLWTLLTSAETLSAGGQHELNALPPEPSKYTNPSTTVFPRRFSCGWAARLLATPNKQRRAGVNENMAETSGLRSLARLNQELTRPDLADTPPQNYWKSYSGAIRVLKCPPIWAVEWNFDASVSEAIWSGHLQAYGWSKSRQFWCGYWQFIPATNADKYPRI